MTQTDLSSLILIPSFKETCFLSQDFCQMRHKHLDIMEQNC